MTDSGSEPRSVKSSTVGVAALQTPSCIHLRDEIYHSSEGEKLGDPKRMGKEELEEPSIFSTNACGKDIPNPVTILAV